MGGKAVIGVRKINQVEAKSVIEDFKRKVLPVLKLNDYEIFVIGSAGNKPNPEDLSGDIDIGVPVSTLSKRAGIPNDKVEEMIFNLLSRSFPDLEIRWMKGIHVISTAWPIIGTGDGIFAEHVQLDIIPIEDMRWAKFIFHQPKDSKYKSAHRNWLLAALCSIHEDNKKFDEKGNLLEFDGILMRLNDGLFKITKSYIGKNKLLKKAKKTNEIFISRNPEEFVSLIFGQPYLPDDISNFEKTWKIVLDNKYFRKNLPLIKKNFNYFLDRVGLPIPTETI
jgi:hypothetical protein